MGTFSATIEIGDPRGERYEAMEALVDTGSSYTWAPRELLERLGVEPVDRWEFETADGRVIERDIGRTWVRIDGRSEVTLVVFGEEGSRPLLGAYTLEGLRLAPDPVNRRLIPVRGLALEVSKHSERRCSKVGSRAVFPVPCSLHPRRRVTSHA